MSHVRSSMPPVELKRDPGFKVPQTKKEFEALTYTQMVQLLDERPDVYERFTKQQKKGGI